MEYTKEDVEKATETLQGYLEGVRNNERLHVGIGKQMIQALCDNFVNKMNNLLTMTTEERKMFVGDSLDTFTEKPTQFNTPINTPQPNGIFGTHGWVCPKCGRVYSPYQSMCLYCRNEEYTTSIGTSPK